MDKPQQASREEKEAQPINEQWQSKAEYAAQQGASPEQQSKLGRMVRISSVVFALSVILLILAMATPVGSIISIAPGADMDRPIGDAHPLIVVALIGVVVSFFLFTIAGIRRAKLAKARKWPYVTLLVVGAVALFNPISGIILLFTVMCNISPCEGT